MSKKQRWVIQVGGYGTFLYEGTEEEAEEMRAHKANWEQAVGRKRLAEDEEFDSGSIDRCANHKGFGSKHIYHCKCEKCKKNTK